MARKTADSYDWHTADDFRIGDRVEIHPRFDAWMAGARYGVVTGRRNEIRTGSRARVAQVLVALDRTGKGSWYFPQDLRMAE